MTSSDPLFTPDLTPQQMLALGVFDGFYAARFLDQLPEEWSAQAKVSPNGPDASYNYFGVSASQPLEVWQQKGWIYPEDPLGWFLWYCRYTMGRRIPLEDARQIKRWKAFARHAAAIKKNCRIGDLNCRRKQRQALLHWGYDSRKI